MKKAVAWVVVLCVVFAVARAASAIGNPWSAAKVFAPVQALHDPACAAHPELCS